MDGSAVEVRPELYELEYPMISVDYPGSRCETQLQEQPDEEALKAFVFETCRAEANWNMKNFIEDQVELIRRQVGDSKVLLALSGRRGFFRGGGASDQGHRAAAGMRACEPRPDAQK